MIGRVKPAAPEPVKINSGSVFHRAKQIRRRWPLVFPATRILLESEIEELASEHALAQHVQGCRRLGVSIVAKLQNRV